MTALRRHSSLAVLLPVLLAAGLFVAVPARADEVPVVRAADTPAEGTRDLTFQPRWTAGGEDDAETILGVVGRVLSGPDGQVLVLDSQLAQVTVFSPDGSVVRTLGRQGDGPGEVQNAGDMLLLPDGTVGIVQLFPGKIVKLHPDGTPAGTFQPGGAEAAAAGGFNVLVRGKTHGDRGGLVGIRQQFAQGKLSQTRFLAVYTADGTLLAELLTRAVALDFSNLVLDEKEQDFCWERWDFLPDGGVVAAPERDRYTLTFYSPAGEPVRRVERAYPPLRREPQDLERQRALLKAQGRFYPSPPRVVVAETEPAVEQVIVRDDGAVWVLSGRGMLDNPAGVLATYDVYDTAGRFLRRVAVHGEGDPRDDYLYLLDGNRAALVRGLRSASLASMGGQDGSDDADAEAAPLELIVGELVP